MTIATRFRDIPFDEISDGLGEDRRTARYRACWEEDLRGKQIVIDTNLLTPTYGVMCAGPFYRIVSGPPSRIPIDVACPHIAEIGD